MEEGQTRCHCRPPIHESSEAVTRALSRTDRALLEGYGRLMTWAMRVWQEGSKDLHSTKVNGHLGKPEGGCARLSKRKGGIRERGSTDSVANFPPQQQGQLLAAS